MKNIIIKTLIASVLFSFLYISPPELLSQQKDPPKIAQGKRICKIPKYKKWKKWKKWKWRKKRCPRRF